MIFFSTHLVLLICLFGFHLGGLWNWSAVGILFVLFPIIEIMTAKIEYRPRSENIRLSEIALHTLSGLLLLTLIYGFIKFNQAQITSDLVGIAASTGVLLGAFGITSAHELIHRRSKLSRTFGVFNLLLINFGHWGIEHVFGHHKHVATLRDPATARRNEIIYLFWLREYFSSVVSAFRISPGKVTAYAGLAALLSVLLYFGLGKSFLFFWWGVSAVSVLLLQTVDYIEHYGLLRQQREDGSYAAFAVEHAWDTSSVLTNVVLFNLGLHSHHHLKAQIPFESLEIKPQSFKMPVGYSFMVVLALFPMFFIPLMNARLDRYTSLSNKITGSV